MDFVRPVEAVVSGVRGRVLAVLVETTAELNLRTIARLAGVSPSQASRVLPDLVALGMVERREAPPASLFRLVPEHVASSALLMLARASETVLQEMGRSAGTLVIPPESVIVFGSFARASADDRSDIDVVVIRPPGVDEDDEVWSVSVDEWRRAVRRMSGNPVEILETDVRSIASALEDDSPLWADVLRDGIVVHGATLEELRSRIRG